MRSDVAVLFDLDGVIIDSRQHHLSAWHQLAREAALTHTPHYFTETFGAATNRYCAASLPTSN